MKKRSARLMAIVLAMMMVFAVLAGCGNTQSPQSSPPQTGTTGESPGETAGAPQNGQSDDSETWTLTATIHVPSSSINTVLLEMYAEDVREATNGRVDIQVFPGGVLASGTSALEAVTNNTVDIAWCYSSYWPGQFPLTDIYSQPLLGVKTADQVVNAIWDLYEKYDELKMELDTDYKILQLYSNPSNFMYFASKKVDSLEALKNIPLRAPAGSISDILSRWGANPIFMGPGDTYEAIEKGIVEGYIQVHSGMFDFNLQELTKYYVNMSIVSGPFIMIMNKDVWDAFPQDIKDQIDSVSGRASSVEAAKLFQEDTNAFEIRAKEEYNIEQIDLSEEEYAKFKAIADEYNQEWIERYTTDSFDAKAYMDDAIAFLAKYA